MISPIRNSYAATSALNSSRTGSSSASFGMTMASTATAASDTATISDAAKAKATGGSSQAVSNAANSIAKLNEAIAAFKKEASLTPAQRARRDVLKTMNLTEEAIKGMPPEQQKATEQKIAAEVARRLRLGEGGKDQMASAGIDAATADTSALSA